MATDMLILVDGVAKTYLGSNSFTERTDATFEYGGAGNSSSGQSFVAARNGRGDTVSVGIRAEAYDDGFSFVYDTGKYLEIKQDYAAGSFAANTDGGLIGSVVVTTDNVHRMIVAADGKTTVNGHLEVSAANSHVAGFANLMTFAEINGDYYMAINAKWDGSNWQRIDTSNPSWLWQFNVENNLIFEPAKYMTLWRCAPGTNPIGNYAAIDGWLLLQSFSQWGDATLGGYGLEIDGNGTVPFARVRHATVSGARVTDLITNAYLDESGVDNDSYPSYVAGIVESAAFEGFKFRGAPANTTPTWSDLFSVDNTGLAQFGTGKTVASLPAANSSLTGKVGWVIDANTPTWSATLVGGGNTACLAFCNGTAWIAK
jgi:hypothetical protein